jgi:hypothetical protein
VGERLGGQARQDDLERLLVARAALVLSDAEEAGLQRRDAAPDAHAEPAPAHLVEHRDLLDQPQRVIQRQHEDHRV